MQKGGYSPTFSEITQWETGWKLGGNWVEIGLKIPSLTHPVRFQ
jgi:hypothetical protein